VIANTHTQPCALHNTHTHTHTHTHTPPTAHERSRPAALEWVLRSTHARGGLAAFGHCMCVCLCVYVCVCVCTSVDVRVIVRCVQSNKRGFLSSTKQLSKVQGVSLSLSHSLSLSEMGKAATPYLQVGRATGSQVLTEQYYIPP
jgi:hypothetical protein